MSCDQFDGCDWLMLVVTCQDLILSLVLYTELEGEVVCTLQERTDLLQD